MRVLVTGGAGFIGSHLVERLHKLGYEIRVLDNLSSGRRENLAGVMGDVDFMYGDVRDVEQVRRAVLGVDAVIHIAALIDVEESVKNPLIYHEVNSTGTLNLLRCSVEQGVKKFIFTSTCAVYGNPVRLPIKEEHPLNPLSPYAASKLSAESYCMAFSASYGLKTTVLRLFNVYGPRQDTCKYSSVIIEFVKRVGKGLPPIIFGDGEQTRDFIYIDDAVEFIVRALEYDAVGCFNVGTGSSVSINRLANLIIKIMGRSHLKPIHLEPRPGDVRHSEADVSKAVKVFDFKPRVTLEEGLKKFITSWLFKAANRKDV